MDKKRQAEIAQLKAGRPFGEQLFIDSMSDTYDMFDGKLPDQNVSMWMGVFVGLYTERVVTECAKIAALYYPTGVGRCTAEIRKKFDVKIREGD